MLPRPQFNMNEALSFGWKTTIDNWKFLIPVTFVYLLISSIPDALNTLKPSAAFSILIYLFSIALTIFFGAGSTRIGLAYIDNHAPELSMFWTTPINRLLTLFAVMIIIITAYFTGLMLLVIPGIYITMYLSQAQYLVIDTNATVGDALKRSGQLTRGVKLSLFSFALVCSAIAIAGILCLGVGILVALPVIALAQISVYRQLVASISEPIEVSQIAVEAPLVV